MFYFIQKKNDISFSFFTFFFLKIFTNSLHFWEQVFLMEQKEVEQVCLNMDVLLQGLFMKNFEWFLIKGVVKRSKANRIPEFESLYFLKKDFLKITFLKSPKLQSDLFSELNFLHCNLNTSSIVLKLSLILNCYGLIRILYYKLRVWIKKFMSSQDSFFLAI